MLRLTVTTDEGILLDSTTVTREEFEAAAARDPHGLLASLSIGARPRLFTDEERARERAISIGDDE